MKIDSIKRGIVIDHIHPGRSMDIYKYLHLDELECSVAIIKNVKSDAMGRKDIIKIESGCDVLNLDALGYIDHRITVNIIENDKIVEKKKLTLPKKITGVIHCKNPRCITSIERGLPDVFVLTNPEKKVYRCIYCDEQR